MKVNLIQGNVMRVPLVDRSVHALIFSPPYFSLRKYLDGDLKKHELGAESHHDCLGWATGHPCGECFVCHVRQYAAEFWRVLRDDGQMWINLGDSYAGSGGAGGDYNAGGLREGQPRYAGTAKVADWYPRGKQGRRGGGDRTVKGLPAKNLMGIPWRCALALQVDGWILRSSPPWIKGNCMPGPYKDRPIVAHEYWYQLTKRPQYYADMEAVKVQSTEQIGAANSFNRNTKEDDIPNQGYKQHRENREETAPSPTRNLRTNDFARCALDGKIRDAERQLAYLKEIRENGGMMFDEVGNPEVLFFNTKGYKGAHFAAYNPDMIEPLIKFSTSEYGVCADCGAQWKRIIEKGYRAPNDEEIKKEMKDKGIPRQKANLYGEHNRRSEHYAENPDHTVGWEPTCKCGTDEVKPAIVLDPFSGTGTTAMVANQLGRIGVGLELSWDYLLQSRTRTGLAQLDAWQHGKQTDGKLDGLPLFAEME